jgi:endo-1,4-beta-xylanase
MQFIKRSPSNYTAKKNTCFKLNYSLHGLFLSLLIIGFTWSNQSYAQLASAKSKFVGNVIGNAGIRTDFTNYWNQVTAENAGKWGSVEGTQGNYNWTSLDNIYNYAVANNFPYKHHTLVWGQQYPGFVATIDSASLYTEIENWIKLTGQKYPKADMVDVVNEPLHSFTGNATNLVKALGGGGTTGWDWVIKAFELARKYWSPTTKLLLNDYNIINSSTATTNYIKIINVLKVRKLIDGIGIQAHSFEVVGPTTSTLKSNLDLLAATGIPIYITEFDINLADNDNQLQKYQTIFPVLYEHPGVVGITLWGYVIDYMWQADAYLIDARKAERPALKWLRNYLVSPFRPIVISPNNTSDESVNTKLTWHSSVGATSYHLQLTSSRTFATMIIDTTISDTLFKPNTLEYDKIYYWRVSAKNDKGEGEFTDQIYFITIKNPVSIEDACFLPKEYGLSQNYPNPFNPTTTISFSLPQRSDVRLVLLDMLGREVINIAYGSYEAGNHNVQLSASNLPSGIYLYRLQTGNFQATKKLIILK